MPVGFEMPTRKESSREELAAQVLSELASHVSDFLWVRDAKTGTILYLNDVWERITGQHLEVGAHVREFFKSTHPDDIERAKQAGPQAENRRRLRRARASDRHRRDRNAVDARANVSGRTTVPATSTASSALPKTSPS